MHCLTVIYPRPADEAAFKNYYENTHMALVRKLPGLKRMHHAYPEPVGPSEVFCIFQAYFESGEAMGAAMASQAGQDVALDVTNYSPEGAQVFHFPVKE